MFLLVLGIGAVGVIFGGIGISRNNDQQMALELQAVKDMVLMQNATDAAASIAQLSGKDMVLMQNVSDLDGRVAAEETKSQTLMDDVAALDSRVTAEEAKSQSLMNDVAALDGRVTAEEAKSQTLMDDLAALDTRVLAEENKSQTLMDDLAAEATARETKDMSLMNDVSNLQGQLDIIGSFVNNNVTMKLGDLMGGIMTLELDAFTHAVSGYGTVASVSPTPSPSGVGRTLRYDLDISPGPGISITPAPSPTPGAVTISNTGVIGIAGQTGGTTTGTLLSLAGSNGVTTSRVGDTITIDGSGISSGISALTAESGTCPVNTASVALLGGTYIASVCSAGTITHDVDVPALIPALAPSFAPSSVVTGVTGLSATGGTTTGAVVNIVGSGLATATRSGDTITINVAAPAPTPNPTAAPGAPTAAPAPSGISSIVGGAGIVALSDTPSPGVTTVAMDVSKSSNNIAGNQCYWCSVMYDDSIGDHMYVWNTRARWRRFGEDVVLLSIDATTSLTAIGHVSTVFTPNGPNSIIRLCQGQASLSNFGGPLTGNSACLGASGGACTCLNPPVGGTPCSVFAEMPAPAQIFSFGKDRFVSFIPDVAVRSPTTGLMLDSGLSTTSPLFTTLGRDTVINLANQPLRIQTLEMWYDTANDF